MPRHEGIRGRWRIVESEMWDQDALDMAGEAHVTFGADGMGEMELIAIRVGIDYRVEKRNGEFVVEFYFDGFDEMDPITGRGRARIVGNDLSGKLFIHQGDESTFLARRQARSNKGARSAAGHRGVRAKPAAARHGRGK